MDLSKKFTSSVMAAMDKRHKKAYEIAKNVMDFLDWTVKSVQQNPMSAYDVMHWTSNYTRYEEGSYDFHMTTSKHLTLKAYRGDDLSTMLNINVANSGAVYVLLTAETYAGSMIQAADERLFHISEEDAQNTEVHKFDFDAYTPVDAVAKILTIIQQNDHHDFGPLITVGLKRLMKPEVSKTPELAA